MKRFAANCLYCSSAKISYNAGVEVQDGGLISAVFQLGDDLPEIHSTVFCDGVIVALNPAKIPTIIPAHCSLFKLLDEWFDEEIITEIRMGEFVNLYLIEEIDWSSKNTTQNSAFRLLSSPKL